MRGAQITSVLARLACTLRRLGGVGALDLLWCDFSPRLSVLSLSIPALVRHVRTFRPAISILNIGERKVASRSQTRPPFLPSATLCRSRAKSKSTRSGSYGEQQADGTILVTGCATSPSPCAQGEGLG